MVYIFNKTFYFVIYLTEKYYSQMTSNVLRKNKVLHKEHWEKFYDLFVHFERFSPWQKNCTPPLFENNECITDFKKKAELSN